MFILIALKLRIYPVPSDNPRKDPAGKRPVRRSKTRWDDVVKSYVEEEQFGRYERLTEMDGWLGIRAGLRGHPNNTKTKDLSGPFG